MQSIVSLEGKVHKVRVESEELIYNQLILWKFVPGYVRFLTEWYADSIYVPVPIVLYCMLFVRTLQPGGPMILFLAVKQTKSTRNY